MANQTEDSIEISAAPDQVLAVIGDLEAYPEWVQNLRSVEILTTHPDGRPDQVRFTLDHALLKDEYTLAHSWSATGVSWQLVEGKLLKAMDGAYALTPGRVVAGRTSTKVTYRLAVDINMPMIGMFRRKAEKTIIEGALAGLKRRVESRHG